MRITKVPSKRLSPLVSVSLFVYEQAKAEFPLASTLKQPKTLGDWLQGLLQSAEDVQWLQTITALGPAWPWPKTDLYHWVPLLNKIDELLGNIVSQYALSSTAFQATPFALKDKQSLLGMLRLTWLLWENCTNRSLYSSYEVLSLSP